MKGKPNQQPFTERRKKARRYQSDRRQMIRWGEEDTDRRSNYGRRKEDKSPQLVKSIYGPCNSK